MRSNKLVKASIIIAFLIISLACEEQRKTQISLGFDFTKSTSGHTTADIPDNAESVTIEADFELQEGVFEAVIINPVGDTIVNEKYIGYGKNKIEKKITPITGTWYMGYQITNNEDRSPEGSFRMTIRY